MTHSAPQLEYGRPRPSLRRLVKWVLLAFVALGAWPVVSTISAFVRMRQPYATLLGQCSELAAPAGTVVYAENAEADGMSDIPGYRIRYDCIDLDRPKMYDGFQDRYRVADAYDQLQWFGGAAWVSASTARRSLCTSARHRKAAGRSSQSH